MFAPTQAPDPTLRQKTRQQRKADNKILTASFIDRNNFAEF